MRIPSGDTGLSIYFVAVDATDFTTRETGLTTFTVYRGRNGATPAAMTTPTVTEEDATNMPGVYSLLLDEDTTIGAGNDSEEMVFHITHAGMAPLTRTIELYRPKLTVGNTLGVASDGDLSEVNTLTGHTVQTGDSFGRLGAPAGASVSADIATVDGNVDAILVDTGTTLDGKLDTIDGVVDAILVDTGTTLPASIAVIDNFLDTEVAAILAAVDTEVAAILVDTGTDIPALIAALNNLSQADVRTAVGLASANLDTQLAALPTAAEIQAELEENGASVLDTVRDNVATILARVIGTIAAGTHTAQSGDAFARLGAPAGASVAADVAAAKTVVDAIKVITDAVGATAATKLALTLGGASPTGAVVAGTLSTTQMTTDLSEATDDHYINRVVLFTTGALTGQARAVTDYAGTTKTLTFAALTEAPTAGDDFVLI